MASINREWQAVDSLRVKGKIIGWQFIAECGASKQYRYTHFHDPYGAALYALQNHKCNATTGANSGKHQRH